MARRGEAQERVFEIGRYWLSAHPNSSNLYITWYDQRTRRTKRTTTHTDDLEQAKLILADYVREQSRPEFNQPHQVILCDALGDYLQQHMKGKRTYGDAKRAIKRFDLFFRQQDLVYVGELKPFHIERYITLRQTQGLSEASIARELVVLRAALNYYRRLGYLTEVPHIRSLPLSPPRDRWLRPEEARRLVAACEQAHMRDYVLIALHTLARPGAILDLRTEQVDLEAGLIRFLPIGEARTNKRKPNVRITQTLFPILTRRIQDSESGYIIEYKGKGVTWSLKASFRKAREKAGLGRDVVPYTLRHTGATWLAMTGISMHEIAGMMGHTVQSTTERYAKHHPDFQANAIQALDDVFSVACD